MSVLTAVEALVPTLEVHHDLVAVVHRHTETPTADARFKDALECAKVPKRFASACNDRACKAALHLADAVWHITQAVATSSRDAAKQQYQAVCEPKDFAKDSPKNGPKIAPSAGRKAWATLSCSGAFVRGGAVAAFSQLGAHGGELVHDAARATLAAAAGWAGGTALPVVMPLAGLVGAVSFEIGQLANNVRAACDTPESKVLAELREQMAGGPVRLPEGYAMATPVKAAAKN